MYASSSSSILRESLLGNVGVQGCPHPNPLPPSGRGDIWQRLGILNWDAKDLKDGVGCSALFPPVALTRGCRSLWGRGDTVLLDGVEVEMMGFDECLNRGLRGLRGWGGMGASACSLRSRPPSRAKGSVLNWDGRDWNDGV